MTSTHRLLPPSVALLALTLTFAAPRVGLAEPNIGTLAKAEQHLQASEYLAAAEKLATLKNDDRAQYLRATALFLARDFSAAEATATSLLETYSDSEWRFKTRFLLARALIEQAKHQEAEAIYAAEAARVFSTDRKQALAERLIVFADKLSREPDPSELDALPADHAKALDLYSQVRAMEVTRELRDDIVFKIGKAHAKLKQHADAIKTFRQYLDEFDPTWTGAVASDARKRGELKENPQPAGTHRLAARAALIDSLLAAGDHAATQQNADDLLALLAKERPDDNEFAAQVRLQHMNSLDQTGTPDQKISNRRVFLTAHPKHARAPEVSRAIGEIYLRHARPDEAVTAYEEFIAGTNYRFEADEKATTPDATTGVSPAEAVEKWKHASAFQVGQIRFNQRNYEAAISAWKKYVARYPNGAQWAASQTGIVNAEFEMALDAVASDNETLARERFDAFLKKYPLDGRSRQILFTLGQMHMAAAEQMEENGESGERPMSRYKQAIEAWGRLISKYPGSEEASLALYRTGIIYSEKLDRLEDGLAAFKRLNWGSWAAPAKGRVTLLSGKSLGVATERTFRTNEQPEIAVLARNIEKVKVSLYPLNLESYFRKTHELARVDHLDIDLIQPQKSWEVEFENYAKYKNLLHKIPVPVEGDGAFAGLVKVEGGDWSATTLVLRSDIDIILKSSRREVLVYVEDRRAGKPAAGAELLLSDGTKIIGTGTTGDDGVFRTRIEALKTAESVRVLARTDRGIATNLLGIGGLKFSSGLSARGYIYTDKPAYRPGERVAVRGILRDVNDGSYVIPKQTDWQVKITDPAGRMISLSDVKLDRFGAFDSNLTLPRGTQLGDYTVAAVEPISGTTWTGGFRVAEVKLERIKLSLEFPQRVLLPRRERAKARSGPPTTGAHRRLTSLSPIPYPTDASAAARPTPTVCSSLNSTLPVSNPDRR